ncbi:hypothetical protein ABZV31_01005 [Streptomyces sp. NPDC005202]|uniref:hypothetical protein n=1 Tax=Streptomyces sp. NPDC005202 TaxID=3157021 RepID=UPI0033B0F617
MTVEVWDLSYRHSEVPLSQLPDVYRSIPSDASLGLTLDDGEDDCVIVTVEPEFSTVTALRDRTFYNLRLVDDPEQVEIMVAGEEIHWPKGCILPREAGIHLLLEAADRDQMWSRHTWVEQ